MPGITFENGSIATTEAVYAWFPRLFDWGTVNGEKLIEEVEYRIAKQAHEDIDTRTIRESFRQLFIVFRSLHGSRTDRIQTALYDLLKRDLHRTQFSGLKESRQRFLILASLARHVPSDRLAEALAGFLSEQVFVVVEIEQPYHLREWGLALHELRGLVPEPILLQLASYLTWPGRARGIGWHMPGLHDPRENMMRKAIADAPHPPAVKHFRGRRHNRVPLPPRWEIRARSVPVLQPRYYGQDLRIRMMPLPPVYRTALPRMRYSDCFDDSDDSEDFQDDWIPVY
jgi:hypothetical protein